MEGQAESLVVRMIRRSAIAGGLRQAARLHPEAAKGLLKAAALHSAKSANLALLICEEARAQHAAASSGKFRRANSP